MLMPLLPLEIVRFVVRGKVAERRKRWMSRLPTLCRNVYLAREPDGDYFLQLHLPEEGVNGMRILLRKFVYPTVVGVHVDKQLLVDGKWIIATTHGNEISGRFSTSHTQVQTMAMYHYWLSTTTYRVASNGSLDLVKKEDLLGR